MSGNILKRRPNEAATPVVGGVAYLIARAFGVEDEPEVVLSLLGIVAFTPTAVTWIVELVRG